MKESQIVLRQKKEKDIFKELKNRPFVHTTMFDPNILRESGMDTELDVIFSIVGWEDFWNVFEQGLSS